MTVHTKAEKLAAVLVLTTAREALKGATYSYLAERRVLELALHMSDHGMDLSVVKELTYERKAA